MFEGFPAHWSTLKKLIWLYKGVMKAASWVWKTVSGSILHITDALAGDVSALSVAINPVQSGSGDPAPDNVRPISGWTQAKIWREVTHDTSANPTLTIDLDGTRYGGTLDVLTGVLTVDRVLVTNNGSSSGTYGYGSFPYISLPGGAIYKNGLATEAITNLAVPTGITNGYILRFANGISGVTDKTSFGALLAQTPMQIVAPLATPTTYQLTPAQLSTLAGENYVWCDTGDISLTYKAAEPNNKVGTAKVGTAKAG